jgi:type I restriction enzyme S subunit
VINGGTPSSDAENWDGDVPWATPIDLAPVNGRFLTETVRTITSVGLRTGSSAVTAGSLIVSTRAPIGYVAQVERRTAFNQGCRGLDPVQHVDIRYFRYQLVAAGPAMQSRGQGSTFIELSTEALAGLPMHIPPLAVQSAIADYLGRETARIDRLIEKRRQMVALMQDRFEAAVYHAITAGVDGPVEMKPSGLSWVGEIPAHWTTPTVSANFDLQLGKMLDPDAAGGPDQYPYLRNVNVQWDRFDLDDVVTMSFDASDRRRCELRSGDLLVCEGGEVGRAAVWRGDLEECFYQKAIHRVRARERADTRFLMYCLRAAAKHAVFAVEGNLSTIVHLTGAQLRIHRFPWPPHEEQAHIVAMLDHSAWWTDRTVRMVTAQIELLEKRRESLIIAAVTGELDIPEVAA